MTEKLLFLVFWIVLMSMGAVNLLHGMWELAFIEFMVGLSLIRSVYYE